MRLSESYIQGAYNVEIVNLLLKPNVFPYLFLLLALVIMCGLIFFAFKEWQLKRTVLKEETTSLGEDVSISDSVVEKGKDLHNYVNTIFQSKKSEDVEKHNDQGELEKMEHNNYENDDYNGIQVEDVKDDMLSSGQKEKTIFSTTTVIEGNVRVDSPLIVKGTVTGDIISSSVVEISSGAVIEGNIQASNIEIDHAKITGDMVVSERVYVGTDTHIKGSIRSKTMIVEGDIEGDVYASEETKLAHNAKVLGNIYTPLIDIDRGAKMSGRIINDELKNNID